MSTIITVEDFTFSYHVKNILRNVNISINEGDIVGLLGENGAGKTTLLNCLYGTLGKHEEIRILSTIPDLDNEMIKNNVAFIEDEPNLLGYLTAEQYLKFICRIEEIDHGAMEDSIRKLILKFALEDAYHSKLLKNYSFGMKKKIHFIGNLLQDKKLFLIDEPTNGLDVGMIISLKEMLIEKNKKANTTMLISSHNTAFLKDICHKVLLFEEGEIVKTIDIEENTDLEREFLNMKKERRGLE